MRLSISEKKGMTSAIINARIHVTATMAAHDAHATNVLECLCLEFLNRRKNTNRELTDYNEE